MKATRITVIFLLSILSAVIIATCNGGNTNIDGPKAVAEAAFNAMREADWERYVEYTHMDALEDFQAQIINGLSQVVPRDSLGNPADSFMILGRAFDTEELFIAPPDTFLVTILSTLFEASPELKQTFSTIQNEIVGGIYEGPNFAHLVIRNEYMFQNEPLEEMSVTSLRQADGEWKLMLTHQIRGVAEMLIQGLQAQARAGNRPPTGGNR